MMHGDGYDLEKELNSLLGGMRIWHRIQENGNDSYAVGYDMGWIFYIRKAIEKILCTYFIWQNQRRNL